MVVYFYFKSYGAMKAEVLDTEFHDEDTDEEVENLDRSKKKIIEGLVSVDFFVSKDALERLINQFI